MGIFISLKGMLFTYKNRNSELSQPLKKKSFEDLTVKPEDSEKLRRKNSEKVKYTVLISEPKLTLPTE